MVRQEELIEFIKKIEISSIKNDEGAYSFPVNNIPITVELLFKVIDVKADDSLSRFKHDFLYYLENIIKISDFNSLPIAIEGLGQKFESFLKIIAFLKGYKTTEFWNGNKYSKGIVGTSLGGLCIGKLENTSEGKKVEAKQLKLPNKLFNFSGINLELVEFVREGIRNKVHYSENYNRHQIITYSEKVVIIYLLVIQDNFEELSKKFLPQFKYLYKVIENSEYKNLDTVYVDLFGKDFSDIDVQGSKVADIKNIINDIEHFNLYSNTESDNSESDDEEEIDFLEEEAPNAPISILEISKKEIAFFLIGDPGAGKTTTLLKILYQNSKSILNGEKFKIPVFVPAKEFSSSNNFLKMIHRIFGEEWSFENLKSGNLQLLIDGLNEITESQKTDAINQIDEIMKDYPECSFIFSERKLSFHKYFDVPVYEVKSLESNQIKEFVFKYGKGYSNKIWTQLSSNKQLSELASNPLMLKMILSISKTGDIPANKGKLYYLFIRAIFEREEKKRHQINYEIKIEALSKVSFCLRSNGEVSCNKHRFKELLKKALNDLKTNIDIEELISDLSDNFIIKIGETNKVSFIHESYLEFFVGYSLMVNFNTSGELQLPAINDNWVEPIQLCIGLIENEQQVNVIINSLIIGTRQGHLKGAKYLNEFDSTDFNNQIYIVSRIGNSCKDFYPEVYKRIEQVLINYLTLWKYLLFEKGTEQLETEILFKAVAFLNSETIYKRIMVSPSWTHLWLSSYEELFKDQGNASTQNHKILSNKRTEIFRNISTSLVRNTSDIFVILKYIESSLIEYGLVSSIHQRLSELKKLIIKNASYKNLKEFYLSNPQQNEDILLKLLETNIEDISLYKFNNHSVKQNAKVLKKFLAIHHQNPIGRKILVEQIILWDYPAKKIIDIINFLLLKGYYSDVIEISIQLINKSSELKIALIDILRQINWELLPESLRALFTVDHRRNISYKIIDKSTENIKIISSTLYTSENKLIFEEGKFINSNSTRVNVVSVKRSLDLNIGGDVILFNDLNHNYQSLSIIFQGRKIELRILSKRISGSGNIVLEIDTENLQLGDDFKWLKGLEININSSLKLPIINIHKRNYVINIEGEIDKLFIYNDLLFIDKNTGEKLSFDEIDNLYFHPSIRKYSPKFYELIIEELRENNEKLIKFLLENRLINDYMNDNSISANFGIVTSNSKEFKKCSIYFPLTQNTIEAKFQNNVESGSIILIDESNKIHRINLSTNLRKLMNSKKGVIIKWDNENNIGFIKAELDSKKSDYFFSAKSCNFYPSIGDNVQFIPAPNSIERFRGKWVAYNIIRSS